MSREHESSIMSSSMNNNCVIASSNPITDSGRPTSRPASQDQPSQASNGARSAKSAGRGRQRPMSTRSYQITQNLIPKSTVQGESKQTVYSGQDSSAPVSYQVATRPSPASAIEVNRNNRKYRQRNRTNQLLEGMSSMATLELSEADAASGTSASSVTTRDEMGIAGGNLVHNTGRKMNLTHLINNKVDGRRRRQARSAHNHQSSNPQSYNSERRNYSSQYHRDNGFGHKFSKQQFLQANCQFVVSDGHDYSIHLVDPDWPVDWDRIEEIRFKQCATTETTCPICLEFPTAAKITKCGHIYCWTCMLQYLSLSDDKCRQCPICFEFVYKNDLRSVVSYTYANYSIEEEITMVLMVRKKGQVLVEPYMTQECSSEILSSKDFDDISEGHRSRRNLMIIDSKTVLSKIVQRERNELLAKLDMDEDEPEVCFVEQALGLIDTRMVALNDLMSVAPNRNQPTQSNHQDEIESKSFLFYQCSDGQHIYLNPFSTKILCQEYGSLENCPPQIQAKVLQMDWISMNESWRKRFKYLEHLPLTCEFRLIEIDFEASELVSKETLSLFKNEILNRKSQRDRLLREERKREKIIEVEQNRKIYGIQPSLKISLNNPDQFPSVSDERFVGITFNTSQQPDEFFPSSDDDDGGAAALVEAQTTSESNLNSPVHDVNLDALDQREPSSSLALSFRDIQLQEAAIEAKRSNSKQPVAGGSWGPKKMARGQTSRQQENQPGSSFAQLLINSSSSKKEWTKNQPKPAAAFPSLGDNLSAPSSNRARHHSDEDADDALELRVPITIGDFIDINVAKKRTKQKKTNKK